MTHPCWPNGDEIKLGHLFHTGDPSTVYTIDLISTNQVGGHATSPNGGIGGNYPIVEVFRVLPPRPVVGDMPGHLAAWLETYDGVRAAGPDDDISANRQRMYEVLDWAKGLLVVDAEIVDDDRPQCDATKMFPLQPGGQLWTCNRHMGHAPRLRVYDDVDSDAGHYDPERGWW